MKTREKFLVAGVGLVGIVVGSGLTIGALNIVSPTERAISIEEKDVPRVTKIYNEFDNGKIKFAVADQILVEDPQNAGEYLPLSKYLERDFKNKYERNLERARINLSVSQREEKK